MSVSPDHRRDHRAPRRDPNLAVVVLQIVTLAALGAAFGAWLGWRSAPARLTAEAASAFATTAAPGGLVRSVDDRSDLHLLGPQGPGTASLLLPLTGGGEWGAGSTIVDVDTSRVQLSSGVQSFRGYLAWRGWHVDRRSDGSIVATSEQLVLMAAPDPGADPKLVTVTITRAEPRPVLPLAFVFAVVGALLGVGWVRLTARREGVQRGLSLGLAVTGGVLLLPATASAATAVVLRALMVDPGSSTAEDVLRLLWGVKPMSLLGTFLVALSLLMTVVPAPAGSPSYEEPETPAIR